MAKNDTERHFMNEYITALQNPFLVDFQQIHWHSKITEIPVNLQRLVFISAFNKIFLIFEIKKKKALFQIPEDKGVIYN